MPDSSIILQDAKNRANVLSEALKTCEPWAREVELQRKDLRRVYLRLLLVHPNTDDAKDTETHLWMATSHAFISAYKERIRALDASTPREHTPVEHRKLVQRFRQFLAEEERFWKHFIFRVRRTYALDDVSDVLRSLEIVPEDAPEDSARPNQIQALYPPENTATPPPLSRDSALAILGKALVCLGDLARYREQYNESGGRPRAGQEYGPPAIPTRRPGRRGRGGGHAAAIAAVPRERDYEYAGRLYEAAQRIVPADGNAYHQLAILANYKGEQFNTLVHYVRSLCVSQPYEPGAMNMDAMLRKALDEWKAEQRLSERERPAAGGERSAKDQINALKKNILVLHGFWLFGGDKNEKINFRLSQDIVTNYAALISWRDLPPLMILQTIILAQGALWRRQVLKVESTRQVSLELILLHVLALHRALWDVGHAEIVEGSRDVHNAQRLDQKITAKLRRMLESLRVTSKWLRANTPDLSNLESTVPQHLSATVRKRLRAELHKCWQAYARFASELARAFPHERLPQIAVPLVEDVEMREFLPLRELMFSGVSGGDGPTGAGEEGVHPVLEPVSEVHPNEEYLMRIRDMITDAHILSRSVSSPLELINRSFVVRKNEPTATEHRLDHVDPPEEGLDPLPEDDVVGDAMRIVLEATTDAVKDDDDDDEEQILWDPRQSHSPPFVPVPVVPIHSPRRNAVPVPLSPPRLASLSLSIAPQAVAPRSPSGTTVHDLLSTFMSRTRSGTNSQPALTSPVSPIAREGLQIPGLPSMSSTGLFGSNPIWAPAPDEGGTSIQRPIGHGRTASSPHQQEQVPSSWHQSPVASLPAFHYPTVPSRPQALGAHYRPPLNSFDYSTFPPPERGFADHHRATSLKPHSSFPHGSHTFFPAEGRVDGTPLVHAGGPTLDSYDRSMGNVPTYQATPSRYGHPWA